MDSQEARNRLLLIARERLRNRAGDYKKFLHTLTHTAQGQALMTRAQAIPFIWGEAESCGSQAATERIAEHLLGVVDWWAKSNPSAGAVSALPIPRNAVQVLSSAETAATTLATGLAAAPVRNRLNGRSNALTAVISQAMSEALDRNNWQSIWAALVAIASRDDRPAPLLGYTEGEGVKYQSYKEANPVTFLTCDALRKRLQRHWTVEPTGGR